MTTDKGSWSSQGLHTSKDPNTADILNMYIAKIHNKYQKPTDINVLQLGIVTDGLKVSKIQNDEIRIVLNIVRA
jgi:hypothetical protein